MCGTDFSRHSPKAAIHSENEDAPGNEGVNGYPFKRFVCNQGHSVPRPLRHRNCLPPLNSVSLIVQGPPHQISLLCVRLPRWAAASEPCPTSHDVLHTSYSWLVLGDCSHFEMFPTFWGNRGAAVLRWWFSVRFLSKWPIHMLLPVEIILIH